MPQCPPQPPVPSYGVAERKPFFGKGLFGWILFIGIAVMLFMLLQKGQSQYANIALSDFQEKLQQDKVARVVIEGSTITGEFTVPETIRGMSIRSFRTQIPNESANWPFMEWLLRNRGNAVINVENNHNLLVNIIVPLIPWVLIFGFIWFFVFRQLRKQSQPRIPFAGYPPSGYPPGYPPPQYPPPPAPMVAPPIQPPPPNL